MLPEDDGEPSAALPLLPEAKDSDSPRQRHTQKTGLWNWMFFFLLFFLFFRLFVSPQKNTMILKNHDRNYLAFL